MRAIAAAVVLGLAGFAAFCARSAPPVCGEQLEARRVSSVVTDYIEAIRSRSCPRLLAVSARSHDAAQCEAELHDFIEHRAELMPISKLARDGRKPQAWLATSKLKADGRERDVVLRVVAGPRGWRVQA